MLQVTFSGNRRGARPAGADLQHPSARSSDITLAFHAQAEDWRQSHSGAVFAVLRYVHFEVIE
jgi:hypothetical protein